MNSELLRLFAHVASSSSFTASADSLGMSRPALSMRIRQLERELGVLLFQRVGRGIEITEAGNQLLVYANEVDRVLQEASVAMQRYDSKQTYHLRVATGRTSGDLDSPLWLSDFLSRYPKVSVKTLICNTTETIDHLVTGRAELGVVGNPPNHPMLRQEHVHDEVLELVCSAAICGKQKTLKRSGWPRIDKVLVREKNSGTRALVDQWLVDQNVKPKHWIELCSDEALRHAAILGVGFAFLPRRLIRQELQNGTLVAFRKGAAQIRMRSCILYPKKLGLTVIGRAFADLVAQYYRDLAA